MTHKPDDNLARTSRELISQWIGQMETFDAWLDRLRRENAEDQAALQAEESAADCDTRQRLDAYYGCDDAEGNAE